MKSRGFAHLDAPGFFLYLDSPPTNDEGTERTLFDALGRVWMMLRSRKYLAHHELESELVVTIIVNNGRILQSAPCSRWEGSKGGQLSCDPPPPPKKVKNTNNEAPQIPFSTSSVTQSQCAPG